MTGSGGHALPRGNVVVYVNGERRVIENADPKMTTLAYLRSIGLTGTKNGCSEGGCSACCVVVRRVKTDGKTVECLSVNSCLTPICALDSSWITTVEGLGTAKAPHPIQERFAALFSSQCGFCSPGFIMTLYELVQNREHDFEDKIGNLCRCTGYRPILDAAKAIEGATTDGCTGNCATCGCKENQVADVEDCVIGSCTKTKVSAYSNQKIEPDDIKLPEELSKICFDELAIRGKDGTTWYRPSSFAQLLALKQSYPQAKLVQGNTEIGIETKFKHCDYKVLISMASVQEMSGLSFIDTEENFVRVGGAATLTELYAFCLKFQEKNESLKAIGQMLKWFASAQIRNAASLAGNVATASPISDMNPMLCSLGATLELESAERGKRTVLVRDFFISYRVVDLKPDELIAAIIIPVHSQRLDFISAFKQAKRREDDISIVTAGMRISLKPSSDSWIISEACFGFGGMAPTTVTADAVTSALVGKIWNKETLDGALAVVGNKALSLPSNVPGGMAEYRQTLCVSFLRKFFVRVSLDLKQRRLDTEPHVQELYSPREASAADTFLSVQRPPTKGYQEWPSQEQQCLQPELSTITNKSRGLVGAPIEHRSARLQSCGEAKFTDDTLPKASDDILHAALVLATVPTGRITKLDAAAALKLPGVTAFYSAQDIKGDNAIGAVIKDEQLFRSEVVTCVGQPLGVIVAESHELAQTAARAVVVEYDISDTDKPVFTIDQAVAAGSYILPRSGDNHSIQCGKDFDQVVKEDPSLAVVEGTIYMGGQEQFYLECNSTVCWPAEDGGLKILSSTQNPTKTQLMVASVLGIPANKVVCTVKRMGGGFGGKETRAAFLAACAAVACSGCKRPIKFTLDRDTDMAITGQRHPFKGIYRAAANPKDSKLVAVDVELYCNAGYSLDLTEAVMDRALLHVENAYKIPNLKVIGYMCKTSTSSNTAFRGFGGPQGMLVAEAYMEHIAAAIGKTTEEVRCANLYKVGDLTHYDQKLEPQINLPKLWDTCKKRSEIESRRIEINAFNSENRYRKRGIAMVPVKFGISFTSKFMNQGGALVHVYTDGTVLVSHGGTEMGQGLFTKVQQCVARAFEIPLACVHVEDTSTDKVPNASPSAASMSTDLYCMAALDACKQILERLEPFRDPKLTFTEIVGKAYFSRVNLSAQGFFIVPHDRCGYDFGKQIQAGETNAVRGQPFNYFTSGVATTEIELDALTGDIHTRRVDIVMDLGSSVNPAIDVGQIEGAFAQGFGLYVLEEMVWGDPEHPWVKPGHLLTKGPGAYKIPSANDTPLDFRVILIDNPNPYAVHSSRAVGEPPLFLASSAFFAIKEAIKDARKEVGLEDHFALDSPLTPERARMACADADATRFAKPNFRALGSF
uniref:Xanthine dehydrogenase n=1 Tax=Aureoumbra lagunensis TaxID=44058 RepID=A0A6S8ELY0_9STRA|mmetsp:Transcript_9775/g.14907  ORF Transcript_9775/g.14907 Transcript_9775/m.14907 type:complete len:1377 (+) Transcript_9775:31-4161(+)